MTNFHSRGKSIEYEPADFGFKDGNQVSEIFQVLIGSMNCGSELAFKAARNGEHLVSGRMLNQDRRGPEDFMVQIGSQEIVCVGLEENRVGTETRGSRWRGFRRGLHR